MRLRCAVAVAVIVSSVAVASLHAEDRFGRLPLAFEENRGQFDPHVDFLARGRTYNVALNGAGAVLDFALPDAPQQRTAVRIAFDGARSSAQRHGIDRLAGVANYYTLADGAVASRREGVPTFGRVRYAGVYPGIDVVYYGNGRDLEYDFVVAPRADAGNIRLRFEGADRIDIDPAGDVLIEAGGTTIRQRKPVLYQDVNGARRTVKGRYVRAGRNEIAFVIGRYDRTRPLVIDPVVVGWGTYLGGNSVDYMSAVAVDGAGAVYVTGQTESADFPVSGNVEPVPGDAALVIAKLNAAGTDLLYSTYINVPGAFNIGNDIAVDGAGDAYVAGEYASHPALFRVGSSGQLKYAATIGDDDFGVGKANGIAIDGAGNAWITGRMNALLDPTPGVYQSVYGGAIDAFVAKIDTDVEDVPSSILWSTYLGGQQLDEGIKIAVDASGNSYITGTTGYTGDFPVTATGYQRTYGGNMADVFVARLSANGTSLLYSTFLGGTFFDEPYDIAIDAALNVYVVGYTKGDFPTTAGTVQPSWNMGNCSTSGQYAACPDGFVAKLNPVAQSASASLVWSTYLGGTATDFATAVAVDSGANVYVTGRTYSGGFPQMGAMSGYSSGGGFITRLNSTATSFLFSSFYTEVPDGMTRSAATGALFLTGDTEQTSGIATAGSYQPASFGGREGFIAKITGLPADGGSSAPFTDDPLTTATLIKVIHIDQLRTRINAIRSRFGLGPFPWNDATLTAGSSIVRALHVTDLRTALAQAYGAASRTAPAYTDGGSLAGVSVKRAHIMELRAAVIAIE